MGSGHTHKTLSDVTKPPGSKRPDKEPTLVDHDEVTADGLDGAGEEESEELAEDSTGERDYPVPKGWDLDDMTNEEFWTKVFVVEDAQMEDLKSFRAALRAQGFLSEGHFTWVRERFTERHGGDTNFQESMMNARKAQNHAQLRQAVIAELLEPIEDISMEIYATIQARRAMLSSAPAAFAMLLAEYNLNEKVWNRIDQAWQARMSDPASPVATDSVNNEYKKQFAAAAKKFRR